LEKKVDATDIRIWELHVPGTQLRIVYNDFTVSVSLEADDDDGGSFLAALASRLNADSR
jgi:hypothetical protein